MAGMGNAGGGDGGGAEVVTIDDSDREEDLLCRDALPGMGGVIVTITGYTGIHRLKLVALINKTGALFLGDLSSGHTHLVCWKYTGKKYRMCKDLGIKIVNHQWFEDCLKAGRRLEEEPYTQKCGEEVCPVTYEETRRARREYATDIRGTQTSYLKELDSMASESKENDPPKKKPAKKMNNKKKSSRPRNHGEQSYLKDLDSFLLRGDAAAHQRSAAASSETGTNQKPNQGNPNRGGSDRKVPAPKRVLQQQKPTSSTSKRKVEHLAPDFFRLKQRKVDSYLQPRTLPPLPQAASEPDSKAAPPIPAVAKQENSTSSSSSMSSSSSDDDVDCVICHDENQTNIEGVLQCGHRFCFDCIKKWGRHSRSNTPECPLCKAPFEFITKREPFISLGDDSQSPRYFETIVPIEKKIEAVRGSIAFPIARSCLVCHGQDAEGLLLVCNVCRNRAVHTFCLDPPRIDSQYPWECRVCLEQGRYRF